MSNAGLHAIAPTSDGEERRGWTSREIRAALVLRGVSITKIAHDAGVTVSAVTQTINQGDNHYNNRFKGYRIRGYIARALTRPVSEIWPD